MKSSLHLSFSLGRVQQLAGYCYWWLYYLLRWYVFVFKAGGLMQFGRWSAITHWRPWLIICDCRHLDLEQGLSKIQLSRSPSSVGFRAFFGSEASQHAPNRDVWRRLSRIWWNIRALFSRTCGCFTLPAFRVLIYRLHSAAEIPSSPWNLNDLHYFWSDLTIHKYLYCVFKKTIFCIYGVNIHGVMYFD